MALNNLRIIYNNLVDLSTTSVTASSTLSTSTPVTNMAKDAKGSVWRSGTSATTACNATLLVDLGSSQTIGGVVLPFTNLSSATATITVKGFTTVPTVSGAGVVTGTSVFSETTVNCCPWNSLSLPNWGTNPSGANVYAYGGGTYARSWLSTANQAIAARYITIEIQDTKIAGSYIEVSRLVIGQYWSPKYNTGYGMTSTVKDLSVNERTQSGDLISQRGPRYNALTFDLKWLDPSDRVQLTKIVLGNGLPRPLLISLFPDNGTQAEMERTHQIYGKMVSLPGITYDMLDIYSTQFDIEEV